MEFLKSHQLDFMLYMSGACGILSFMTMMAKLLSKRRKSILVLLEFSAMLILLFDRYAYLYKGDPGEYGFFMVRISNGLVFFLTILIPHLVTQYIRDLYSQEGGIAAVPRRLLLCEILFVAGTILLVISQFTGLYYTFDAQNSYQRSRWFFLSYIIPFLIVVLQESVILQFRGRMKKKLVSSLAVSIALPSAASILQFFFYGLSLTNLTIALIGIIFFVYVLNDYSDEVERVRNREIESFRETQRKEAVLFEQTMEALANAIDAKDRYTHGHSTRVARYSKRIAEEAGFSKEECGRVYFAALLHDVGKIGVPDRIINKTGGLTDEEFEQVKIHPVLGGQILSNIRQSPYLGVGARSHHERYDGTGYPDGLSGKKIPQIARIIAVADAYDAMTSRRSYRDFLPQEKVRKEIENGSGTQFDPAFAAIMLRLIDEDTGYRMREPGLVPGNKEQ